MVYFYIKEDRLWVQESIGFYLKEEFPFIVWDTNIIQIDSWNVPTSIACWAKSRTHMQVQWPVFVFMLFTWWCKTLDYVLAHGYIAWKYQVLLIFVSGDMLNDIHDMMYDGKGSFLQIWALLSKQRSVMKYLGVNVGEMLARCWTNFFTDNSRVSNTYHRNGSKLHSHFASADKNIWHILLL